MLPVLGNSVSFLLHWLPSSHSYYNIIPSLRVVSFFF
jgi:hypothetical protein